MRIAYPTTVSTAAISCCLWGACHYDVERHRLAQDRKLYDDMCARGHNVWRMMYEGTDSAWHYFLVNDMDRWAHVKIPAQQIIMAEQRAFRPLPGDTAKGYWINPCNDFRRSEPWVHGK